jgi:hypothetical protein
MISSLEVELRRVSPFDPCANYVQRRSDLASFGVRRNHFGVTGCARSDLGSVARQLYSFRSHQAPAGR